MTDCLIVGGGVIGLLSAYRLQAAGVEVLLVERGELGGESSWAGGGIISPLYPWRYHDAVNVLAQRSKQIYAELVPELERSGGVDAELINSGLLIVHDDELEDAMRWAEQYGETVEHLKGAAAMRDCSRSVDARYDKGLWMPTVHQVRNPLLVKALRAGCEARGIGYLEHAEVSEIIVEQDRVRGVRLADGERHADRVVVASGAWSGKLLAGRAEVEVEPVKGQMVMMQTEPGSVDTMLMAHGHYVIPRKDGHVLAGSTLEHSGFDKSLSANAREDLYRQACELAPVLANSPVIRHWSGLRPGTRRGIPYVCEHDRVEGLYIHAGHYRNGIVLGAASAELLAQIITGGETFCDPTPYNLHSPH